VFNITNPECSTTPVNAANKTTHPNPKPKPKPCLPFQGYTDSRFPVEAFGDWFRPVFGTNSRLYIIKFPQHCGTRCSPSQAVGTPLHRCASFFGKWFNTPCVRSTQIFPNRVSDRIFLLFGDPGIARRR
jgi:hypothetical protein